MYHNILVRALEFLRLHIIVELWWQLLDREHGQSVLHRIEVVVLSFDQVIFAPFREPLSLLVFDNHLHFLMLQHVCLQIQLDAEESLSQKILAEGFVSSNLEFVKISTLISISDVKDFLLENIQLLLLEKSFSDCVKLG